MIEEYKVDDLINESINALADDNPKVGAETLVELAHIFAKAGMQRESFNNIRKHIIEQAIKRTDPLFIKAKLEGQEQLLQGQRNGKISKIIH